MILADSGFQFNARPLPRSCYHGAPLDLRRTRMDGNRLARKVGTLSALLLAAALCTLQGEEKSSDLAAARALFEKNLQAIRVRSGYAYLSCYLDSERLRPPGPEGS